VSVPPNRRDQQRPGRARAIPVSPEWVESRSTSTGQDPGDHDPGGSHGREILALARLIPEGFVSTYGDLCPAAPRFAGSVMSHCEDASVPWHRVVRADGSLAVGERQRALLEAEGVPFVGERVDLRAAWFAVER
jgi:methylated-DNA-protein-cysteine methyltransferase-like protein